MVVGSRWEGTVRHAHHLLTGAKNSLYDYQTIEVMRRVLRPDSVAIDIGAFEGGMLRHMIRFAPLGRHLAFEPLPHHYDALARRFPRVRVFPFAVGAESGVKPFYEVVRYPALSGLRRRIDLSSDAPVLERSIPTRALDSVVPPETPIRFVKIDVEGGEFDVFQGGVETLRRSRPVIVFECGHGGADSYGVSPSQIFDLLTDRIGLRIFLLDQWLAERGPLSRDEFIEQYDRSLNYYFVAGS